MKQQAAQSSYQSFLLRLWVVRDFGRKQTRATLVDVKSGVEQHFTSIEALVAYLQTQDQAQ